MTHISKCVICEAQTINNRLCLDCQELLADEALRDHTVDRNRIKKESKRRQCNRIQEALQKELDALDNCPFCGRKKED